MTTLPSLSLTFAVHAPPKLKLMTKIGARTEISARKWRNWTENGDPGLKMGPPGTKLSNFGPILTNLDNIWTDFDHFGTNFDQFGTNFDKFWTNFPYIPYFPYIYEL